MSPRPRLLAVAMTALGLVVGLALGAGVVLARSAGPTARSSGAGVSSPPIATMPIATMPIATLPIVQPPSTGSGGTAASGMPAGAPTTTASGAGSALAGTAIAYPIYAGTPGVAPDHTIVVTGIGQAQIKADGSDQAGARASALEAALADARAQAAVIARSTGLTISGVLSVATVVSPSGFAVPMAASGAAPGAPVPGRTIDGPSYLSVSVTVAYRVA